MSTNGNISGNKRQRTMSIKIRQVTVHGHTRWQVDFGKQPGGKRPRPIFKTEDEAKKEAKDFETKKRRLGEAWLKLSEPERDELISFYVTIRRRGLTLPVLMKGYDEWENANKAKPQVTSKPYKDAVNTWREEKIKSGKDEGYVEDGAKLLLRFAEGRVEQPINEFTFGGLRSANRRTSYRRAMASWREPCTV